MRRIMRAAAIGLIGFGALVAGGCLAIHAEEDCHCARDRDKFARQVAKQVVEEQNKQDQEPGPNQDQ